MNLTGDLAFIAWAVGVVAFVALYWILVPSWWRTPMGRNIMAFIFAVGVVPIFLGLLWLIVGEGWFLEHRDLLRTFFYSFAALVIYHRISLLIRYQAEPRRKRRHDREAERALGRDDDDKASV